MGGEVELDMVEHNIAFDHVAANFVFNSGIPIYMGTWSITRQFFFTMEECDVFRNHSSELARKMGEAIDIWHPIQHWKPGPVMYDIFPMISPVASYYTYEKRPVAIVTQGEETGKTIIAGNNDKTFFATDIKADEIKQLYLETVLSS